RNDDDWFQVEPSADDFSNALDRRTVLDRGAAELHYYHWCPAFPVRSLIRWLVFARYPNLKNFVLSDPQSNNPRAFISSALRIAAPAAPRIVLCDNTTNRISNTGHSRIRPTTALIPFPASRSNRGCGRSRSWVTMTGFSGANGSLNS